MAWESGMTGVAQHENTCGQVSRSVIRGGNHGHQTGDRQSPSTRKKKPLPHENHAQGQSSPTIKPVRPKASRREVTLLFARARSAKRRRCRRSFSVVLRWPEVIKSGFRLLTKLVPVNQAVRKKGIFPANPIGRILPNTQSLSLTRRKSQRNKKPQNLPTLYTPRHTV